MDTFDFHYYNDFHRSVKREKIVKIEDLVEQSLDVLVDSFRKIPFIKVEDIDLEPTIGNMKADIRAKLKLDGETRYILAEVKNNGEPRYARQAVNQLLAYQRFAPDSYGVFIAPYISPEAAEICREAGIGFLDLAGNSYISFEGIYINKQGNPNPYTRKGYLRSLYYPKTERILRVMLLSGPREWKVEELAKEASVSVGLVAKVKKLLEDREWIDAQTIGFSLTQPFALLEEWSQEYSFRRNTAGDYYTMLSISEWEQRLGEVCQKKNIPYALTGFSAAARIAPSVRYQRAMAYVLGEQMQDLVEQLDIKSVTSGANVTILDPYDEGVFYGSQLRNGLRLVSPVQMYLDLKSFRGRGEEAAEAILGQVIEKIW